MENKRELWTKRIQEFKSSGLSAPKWSKKNNISVHTLRYWIKKFKNEKQAKSKKVNQWASVIPAVLKENKELNIKPIKITVGCSTIEVVPGFDHETFKSIVRILKEC